MARIVWDKSGEHSYEVGVDHVTLYLRDEAGAYTRGYAWNGVTSIAESPSGAEATKQYADNIPYLTLISAEEFAATIEAFSSPEEFDECNGETEVAKGVRFGQQKRSTFGLSYRTKIGDDVNGQDKHYKLHLMYGVTAAPSERSYATVNESPEAMSLSWSLNSNPESAEGMKATSLITIDSRDVNAAKLADFEKILYGDKTNEPRLPKPDEVAQFFKESTPGQGE